MPDDVESMRLQDMKTGEVKEKAREAGVEDLDTKNKQEMIDAMGGDADAGKGGGQSASDPAPEGVDPADYKDVPGNQS
jgi:hypothetical protein